MGAPKPIAMPQPHADIANKIFLLLLQPCARLSVLRCQKMPKRKRRTAPVADFCATSMESSIIQGKGRAFVAASDIAAGDLLLRERA